MAEANGVVGYVRVASRADDAADMQEQRDRLALGRFAAVGGFVVLSVHVDRYGLRRAGLPHLAEAIAACRDAGALLVVARAGPLLRDAAFFDALIAADCPFHVIDAPGLDRNTLPQVGLRAYRADLRKRR